MPAASLSVLPSPISGRIGGHNFPFEACSGFTHVTARRFAPPPKARFVAGLRRGRLPSHAACRLPGQPTIARVGFAPTRLTRASGRTRADREDMQIGATFLHLPAYLKNEKSSQRSLDPGDLFVASGMSTDTGGAGPDSVQAARAAWARQFVPPPRPYAITLTSRPI